MARRGKSIEILEKAQEILTPKEITEVSDNIEQIDTASEAHDALEAISEESERHIDAVSYAFSEAFWKMLGIEEEEIIKFQEPPRHDMQTLVNDAKEILKMVA